MAYYKGKLGIARGIDELNMGVDLWLKRNEEMFIADFRKLVWNLFMRILRETPQYTGKAVANWNIGVGAPDFSFHYEDGDKPKLVESAPMPGSPMSSPMGGSVLAPQHERGDEKWIKVAKDRNRHKIPLIVRNTRVYISNGTVGDNDHGELSSNTYLEELQNPSYWMAKLREVNQPYETAQMSMMVMLERENRLRNTGFKPGGTNYQDYE